MKQSVQAKGRSFELRSEQNDVRYVGRLSGNVEGYLAYQPTTGWKPVAIETNPFLLQKYTELNLPLSGSPEEALANLVTYAEAAERRFQSVRNQAAIRSRQLAPLTNTKNGGRLFWLAAAAVVSLTMIWFAAS